MKTIFITIYDGAISKNILRTDIFKTIRTGNRIVLFVPHNKFTYYREHFSEKDVNIEISPPADHPRFEAKFQSLALDLFHTESVRLKILHHYAVHGNVVRLFFKLTLWHIGRFRVVHKALRILYRRIPDRSFDSFFDKYDPDLVFVPNMLSNEDYRLIKTAWRHGVPSIGMPKSWDNLTTKTFFNVFPDSILIQSKLMKDTAVGLFGYPAENITVVGHPAFDTYASSEGLLTREEFCKKLGLNPSQKIILYGAGGSALAPHDEEVLSLLVDEIRSSPDLQGVQIVVRPHPKYEFNEKAISFESFVVLDNPGITLTAKKSSWEFLDEDIVHLKNSLVHADLLISTASTLNLEGAILDKSLLSIAFDGDTIYPLALSVARYYRYEHLRPLVESGGMKVAYSKEELFLHVRECLADPNKDTEGRKDIVESLVWRADGCSGKRVSQAILNKLHGIS